ncbi:MAG TPA: hypothetical protein VJ843_02175 [Candidatus Saccharimonadales bacterium]|nr:hypothetical protein [Candidatus Saccharimonadales bacterium]
MIRTIITKSRSLLVAAAVVSVVAGSASAALVGTKSASAATSCDKVNIVYCGLDGSTDASYIASFKSSYTSNNSGHASSPTVKKDYTDLKTVYSWAGVTASDVTAMTAANTKVGTLYKDGHIVVDGKTVATGAWVSARFTEGSGYVKVSDGVYARKTTTSFANATAKVIVYMPNGTMKWAVMVECGNAVKATPVETPKTPETPTTPETPQTPETPTVTTTSTPVTTTATTLPNTGAGDVIGLFSGVSVAGGAAHHIMRKRRAERE